MTRQGVCAFMLAIVFVASHKAGAEERTLIPIEREKTLESLPFGESEGLKAAPRQERVNIKKEELSAAPVMGKKDPLVTITGPTAGGVSRLYQKVTGRIGGGIRKAFLRINDDTQIVTVTDGTFETYCALRPGPNTIVAMAWDLEGNLGRDAVRLVCTPEENGPRVSLESPRDGTSLDITDNRVITVTARAEGAGVTGGVLVVNNMPRRVGFENGVMSQELALFSGTNEIYVEAEDAKGHTGRSSAVRVSAVDARPKDLVAVLTWDSRTADLDLHAWDSFGHHTFNDAPDAYQCEASIPYGMLDMDRKGNYGPEVFSLEYAEPEVYTFYARYNPGLKEKGASGYLRILLHGDEPARRIMRSFGPSYLSAEKPAWEAACVKMPEGVFFEEKDADLIKTLGMDKKAVRRLALVLEEESAAFKLLAVSAMGQIKSEEAVGPLLKALASGAPEIRRAAAGALWSIKSVKATGGLIRALKDSDAEVRRAAAGALGAISDPAAMPALTGMLADEADTAVRMETVRSIGKSGDADAAGSLLPHVSDPDVLVRVEALRALGRLKAAGVEETVVKALTDDKEGCVREVAAWALGRLGSKSATRYLMDALHFDESEGARVQAAVSLGMLKDGSALNELENAASKDDSRKVRFCAGKAMEAINAAQAPSDSSAQSGGHPPPKPSQPDDQDVVVYQ